MSLLAVTPDSYPLAFYQVMASVIPLLFISVVLQSQFVKKTHPYFRLPAITIFILAEYLDLMRIIDHEKPSNNLWLPHYSIWAALLLAALALVGPLLRDSIKDARDQAKEDTHKLLVLGEFIAKVFGGYIVLIGLIALVLYLTGQI